MVTTQQRRNKGELQLIQDIRSKHVRHQTCTPQQHKPLSTKRCKGLEPILPSLGQRHPVIKSLYRSRRCQQPAPQRLLKKSPVLGKIRLMTDHNSRRLGRTPLNNATLLKLRIPDQTGALMGSQGSSTNQASISPDQGLLESIPITIPPQLSCPAFGGCQSTVEADGQYEAHPGDTTGVSQLQRLPNQLESSPAEALRHTPLPRY